MCVCLCLCVLGPGVWISLTYNRCHGAGAQPLLKPSHVGGTDQGGGSNTLDVPYKPLAANLKALSANDRYLTSPWWQTYWPFAPTIFILQAPGGNLKGPLRQPSLSYKPLAANLKALCANLRYLTSPWWQT